MSPGQIGPKRQQHSWCADPQVYSAHTAAHPCMPRTRHWQRRSTETPLHTETRPTCCMTQSQMGLGQQHSWCANPQVAFAHTQPHAPACHWQRQLLRESHNTQQLHVTRPHRGLRQQHSMRQPAGITGIHSCTPVHKAEVMLDSVSAWLTQTTRCMSPGQTVA
jgi:hypothetical protein